MNLTPIGNSDTGTAGRLPVAGLFLVQIVIGYEWLVSGLAKVVRGDFPGGLAGDLAGRAAGAPGWYRGFLSAVVFPNARVFGYLIEIAELLTGAALVAVGLAWLVARERLGSRSRTAGLLTTSAAALAGLLMNVNFHLASGSPQPWRISAESFEEAVDLDSVMAALELVLLVVSAVGLPSSRSRRRRALPQPIRLRSSREEMIVMTSTKIRRSFGGRSVLWSAALLAVGLALGAAFLGGTGVAAVSKDPEVAILHADLAQAQEDATLWKQLTTVLKPAPAHLRSMQDHRLYMLPSGIVIGLHFDNMNLAKAKNLNWVVFGVPGVFTKADQQRVARQYGPGFTHFHDLIADTHGGKPGAKGAWFVHTGARNFTSPFGQVTAGAIDSRFMPTPPRS